MLTKIGHILVLQMVISICLGNLIDVLRDGVSGYGEQGDFFGQKVFAGFFTLALEGTLLLKLPLKLFVKQ